LSFSLFLRKNVFFFTGVLKVEKHSVICGHIERWFIDSRSEAPVPLAWKHKVALMENNTFSTKTNN